MISTALALRAKHSSIGRLILVGMLCILLGIAGCGLTTNPTDEDDWDGSTFEFVSSVRYFEVNRGRSAAISIGALGPIGATVSNYAIDTLELDARISITTQATSDCPELFASQIPAGYEVGSCQRWTFSPEMDAIPGLHRIVVLPQSPSIDATTSSGLIRIGVLASGEGRGALAATSVSGKTGLWSVLTRDRNRWSWGYNANGAVGVGGYESFPISTVPDPLEPVTYDKLQPESVYAAAPAIESEPYVDGWIDVAASQLVGLAVSIDGSVYSWGRKRDPVMGRTVTINGEFALTPGPIQGLDMASAVAASADTGFAIIDGRVRTWGSPDSTLLGIVGPADPSGFQDVEGLANVFEISVGSSHVLALQYDGSVWSWGNNQVGQLGIGPVDNDYAPVPVNISELQEVRQVVAVNNYSMALDGGRSVYIWGLDQPAHGDFADDRPVLISGFNFDTSITRISAGRPSCTEDDGCTLAVSGFALDSDGYVWRWGNDSSENQYQARLIPSLDNVISIGSDKAITGDCSVGGYVWDLAPTPDKVPRLLPVFGRADPDCPAKLFVHIEGHGSVSVDPNGVTCTDYCSYDVIENADLLVTAIPDADSTFVEWQGSMDCGANNGVIQVNGAVQCIARFESFTNLANLTVTKGGSGAGTVTSDPVGIDCGADCEESYVKNTRVALDATPDSDSVFERWSGDSECDSGATGSQTLLDVKDDISCEAVFSAISVESVTLTVTREGAGAGIVTADLPGINCGTDCSEDIPIGDHIVLTATAEDGSVYAGWSGDGDCGNPDFVDDATGKVSVTVRAEMTCTATFDVESTSADLALTVSNPGDGHGRVTSTPAGIESCTFQAGTVLPAGCNTANFTGVPTVTLSAEAIDGAFFEGWQGCDRTVASSNGGDDCEVDAGGARTVEALFVF